VDRTPPTVDTTTSTKRINPNSTMPHARYSPNLYPACDRDSECTASRLHRSMAAEPASRPRNRAAARAPTLARRRSIRAAFANQLVAEIDSTLTMRRPTNWRASRTGPDRIAEFSADRRHHRPVPHHRQPPGRYRAPRVRYGRRRALGASSICAIGCRTESADRGRSRAIRRRKTSPPAGPSAGARHETSLSP